MPDSAKFQHPSPLFDRDKENPNEKILLTAASSSESLRRFGPMVQTNEALQCVSALQVGRSNESTAHFFFAFAPACKPEIELRFYQRGSQESAHVVGFERSKIVPVDESVIIEAVSRYDRERDRYIKLASRVADLCRTAVVEDNAIRAQVTSRTKTVRSFEGKLRRFGRRPDKSFGSVDEVFAKISDFAGVRVATYRPEDEVRVAELVTKLFCGPEGGEIEIDLKDKLDPAKAQFYRSTHCQVFLRKEELVGDYGNLRGASCEIQICSMMAHVWNEIEHDIGYKPEGGGPGDAERGLLQILGHLTRSGDVTITQLLAANTARMTAQTGDFSDVYDFVARLRRHFPDADLSVNAGPAYDAAMILGLSSVEKLDTATAGKALQPPTAAQQIGRFNAFLEGVGRAELALNSSSADLILISLLKHGATVLEENLSGSLGQPRLGRLIALARAYQEYSLSGAAGKDAA